jgi:hypothetical protein
MKTKTFTGNRYDIAVVSDRATGYFEIIAIHRFCGRTSSVTNLNAIIGEILAPVLGEEFMPEDSDIQVTGFVRHQKLVKYAEGYLADGDWIGLEEAFDEDRGFGEWTRRSNSA